MSVHLLISDEQRQKVKLGEKVAVAMGRNYYEAALSDKLYDLGFVHDVNCRATCPFLCATATVLMVVMMVILIRRIINARAALA